MPAKNRKLKCDIENWKRNEIKLLDENITVMKLRTFLSEENYSSLKKKSLYGFNRRLDKAKEKNNKLEDNEKELSTDKQTETAEGEKV